MYQTVTTYQEFDSRVFAGASGDVRRISEAFCEALRADHAISVKPAFVMDCGVLAEAIVDLSRFPEATSFGPLVKKVMGSECVNVID